MYALCWYPRTCTLMTMPFWKTQPSYSFAPFHSPQQFILCLSRRLTCPPLCSIPRPDGDQTIRAPMGCARPQNTWSSRPLASAEHDQDAQRHWRALGILLDLPSLRNRPRHPLRDSQALVRAHGAPREHPPAARVVRPEEDRLLRPMGPPRTPHLGGLDRKGL